MELDMDAMASAIGISVAVLRFLICFIATIPVRFLWRFIPGGPPLKHFYAAATGAILSYLSFGFSSNLHFLVPMLMSYGSMVLYRRRCGLITLFPFFTGVNPNVIALLDCKSYSYLFDNDLVDKAETLLGEFRPNVNFAGDVRVCPYLDTSEPNHAKIFEDLCLFY